VTDKNSRKERPALSPLELAVMDVVWNLGDCTSAEVIAEFGKKRSLAPTTIRTVLANLRGKGYIRPIPTIGRGYKLRPSVAREAVARRSLRQLLSSLFKNSPQQAIAYMLDDADVSDEELDEIRRMIDQRKNKGG